MAAEPEVVLTDEKYKGLDPDIRNFYNVSGTVYSAFKPQVGDIIEDRGRYFEVDNVNEIQFFLGKDKDYGKNVGAEFGRNISIQITSHLARVARLQIIKARL